MKEEIKSIREILDRLEAAYNKKEPAQEVKLEDGFLAGLNGNVIECQGYARDTLLKWLEYGHWFSTREEAAKEIKRRAVIQKMRGFTKGFAPDWEDKIQVKVCIVFDHSYERFCIERREYFQGSALFEIYFRTREDAQACIDAMGDEIKEVL